MSIEQAKALMARVAADPEFAADLEATPIEQRRDLLVEAGYGDVKLRHLSAALPQSAGGELTDDEFAAVAGGKLKTGTILSGVGSGVGSAVAVAVPAAAALGAA